MWSCRWAATKWCGWRQCTLLQARAQSTDVRKRLRFLEHCREEMREAGQRGVARLLVYVGRRQLLGGSLKGRSRKGGGRTRDRRGVARLENRSSRSLAGAARTRSLLALRAGDRANQIRGSTMFGSRGSERRQWKRRGWAAAERRGGGRALRSSATGGAAHAEAWVGEGNRMAKGDVTVTPDTAFVPRPLAETEAEYESALAVAKETRGGCRPRFVDRMPAGGAGRHGGERGDGQGEVARAVVIDKAEG